MNAFFMATNRPFKFVGRINEDVNTYVSLGKTGTLFLTHPTLSVCQLETQSNSGGLTEFYLDQGTFVKSFYTLLFCPSSVKVSTMGQKHLRLHHRVK